MLINIRDTWCRFWVQIELTCGTEETYVSDDIRVQNDLKRPSRFQQRRLASRSIQCDLRVSPELRFNQAQCEAHVQKHPIRSPWFKARQESHLQQIKFAPSRRRRAILASSSTSATFSLSNTRVCPFFCNQFNSILAKSIIKSTSLTVHQQTNQSSDKF